MDATYRFEALFNHASMGIVVVNSAGLIQSINPFGVNLFDYTTEELINKPIEVLIPGRYHHKHIHHRDSYIEHPKSRPMGVGMDLYAVRKNGEEFPVEVSLGNYKSNNEDFAIAFISDISVRKKAEAEIVKLNDELEATVEQRTRDLKDALNKLEYSSNTLEDVLTFQKAILDNAGAMIIATDQYGEIRLFNPEASKNLGYPESDVIAELKAVTFHDKNEINEKRKNLLNEYGLVIEEDFAVLVEKSRRNIHEEEQYKYIRKDGSSFPVSLTITAIKENNEETTGFLFIAIDISERIKAEEDLRRALEKEKDLSELKSRFVSMASHEFRTPLSTVLSSAYLIEKYQTIDEQPKREKHLQRIVSSVDMLTETLNDFLSVEKIEEGKIQLRLSQFNIQVLITSVTDEMINTLKKQQKIRYQHSGDPEVLLDPSLLKHIIMNLVSNASKFSQEDSFIDINSVNNENEIILSVRDYGIGISKEDQKHLMEPFFRGSNVINIQGTGLGLHIVSKYSELMNGNLKFNSELEKGTEIIITFKK